MSINELLGYVEHGDAFITWLSETEIQVMLSSPGCQKLKFCSLGGQVLTTTRQFP